jgi:hypothetical protein
MLSFKSAARALASLTIVAFAAGLFAAPSIAQVQTVGSPIGLQTAYAGMKSRPWYADQPNYFKPFDFQWADGKFWVNGWAGVIAEAELSSILFTADYSTGDVGVVGMSLGREFGSIGNSLRFEWETGASFHFGDETFATFHAYLIARWIYFPWNKWLMTTFAMGTGPSLATKKSKYEKEDGEASYYKNGMMMEFTFNLPEQPDWLLQLRIQHRSSIFGVLPNAGTPSDYLTVGFKHRF